MRAVSLLSMVVPLHASSQCLPLTVHGGAFYTSPLVVGTPAQQMNVVTDTGSYVFLLDSTFCTDHTCTLHTRFDANQSSTSANPRGDAGYTVVTTSYGQGAVEGIAWRDSVTVGDVTHSSVDMLLMAKSSLSGWDADDEYDGIMGLGRQAKALAPQKSGLTQQALLTAMGVSHFTMCLGGIEDGGGGRLELGAGQLETSVGTFVSTKPTGMNAWASAMDSVVVGSQTIDIPNLCNDSIKSYGSCATIVDSGTTLLVLPSAMHEAFDNAIRAECDGCLEALEAQEDCDPSIIERMPSLNITLGGRQLSLDARVYMAPVELSDEEAETLEDFDGNHRDRNVTHVAKGASLRKHGGRRREHAAATHDSSRARRTMSKRSYGGRPHPYRFVTAAAETKVGCVPLFSSTDEVPTNVGPIVILGMPIFRQYAVRFDRNNGVMSFAHLTAEEQDTYCGGCPTTVSEADEEPATPPAQVLQPEQPASPLKPVVPLPGPSTGGRTADAGDKGLVRLMQLRFPKFTGAAKGGDGLSLMDL